MSQNPFSIIEAASLPRPSNLVQVGASGGQELELFKKSGISNALLIEPITPVFEILKQNCMGYPNYHPYQAIISEEDNKVVDFYLASNSGQSSSILEPQAHINWYPGVKFNKAEGLISKSLDTVIKAESTRVFSDKLVDMLYMDVQGAEMRVLEGAPQVLHQLKYIFMEVSYGNGYRGDFCYTEILAYMRVRGFDCVSLFINPFHKMGDALFYRPKL